jgi:hypothetical protein
MAPKLKRNEIVMPLLLVGGLILFCIAIIAVQVARK